MRSPWGESTSCLTSVVEAQLAKFLSWEVQSAIESGLTLEGSERQRIFGISSPERLYPKIFSCIL